MGNIPNVVGIWVVRIAIGWLAWELTESSFWVGAVAAADALPVLLFGPIGGVLADRMDRKHIAVVTQAILTVIAVLLTVTTLSGFITIWLLFGFALARGITFSFWQPVRLALMPNLVPREQLPTAIALNSSTFNAAQFIGPAFAAVLLTAGGPGLAFASNILAAAVMVWALAQVELPARAARGGAKASFLDDALAGIRYGAAHPGIGPMLLLLLVLGTTIRPLTELLSAVAGAVFLLEVGGFSAMASSVGIGAMTGAIWMLRRGQRRPLDRYRPVRRSDRRGGGCDGDRGGVVPAGAHMSGAPRLLDDGGWHRDPAGRAIRRARRDAWTRAGSVRHDFSLRPGTRGAGNRGAWAMPWD